MASLRRFGQRKPIVVNELTSVIEAGNGTYEAAMRLGWTQVAVVYVNDKPSDAKAFSITDNRTAELASWDMDGLSKALAKISTGDDGLDAMLAELAKTTKWGGHDVVDVATIPDYDPADVVTVSEDGENGATVERFCKTDTPSCE